MSPVPDGLTPIQMGPTVLLNAQDKREKNILKKG